jgi:hypothetical protein
VDQPFFCAEPHSRSCSPRTEFINVVWNIGVAEQLHHLAQQLWARFAPNRSRFVLLGIGKWGDSPYDSGGKHIVLSAEDSANGDLDQPGQNCSIHLVTGGKCRFAFVGRGTGFHGKDLRQH